jgi:3-deoxy-D-manno-octulosonate 8-phosphate phosphatase (KDO 8-P phosphatase)
MPGLGTNLKELYSDAVIKRAARIKLLLMDVDGVLTDGKLFYIPGDKNEPVEFKAFNSQDGIGFHMLNSHGIKTGVISGRESPAVTIRGKILKMSYIYQGLLDKEGAYEEIIKDSGLTDEETAFIGDDFTDAPLMRRTGLACAVGDARKEVKAIAHLVTEAKGGHGAVREVIECILRSQGKWRAVLDKYQLDQC